MAPIAQEWITIVEKEIAFQNPDSKLTGDEVVISGISGVFPKSNNVQEFMDHLYNKVDMVTSSKKCWPFIHPEMPGYYGKVSGFDKFDTQFFRVPHGTASFMDVMTRKLLENSYGALFDAGVSPVTLAGTNLGVFVGCSFTDMASTNLADVKDVSKYKLTGSSKTMQSNRISYWIDGKGPSYGIDVACASSIVALEHAYWAIKSGKCSSAIVGGSNNLIDPTLTLNMKKAGLLCMDGKTKCFDKNADGYVRSEAVSLLFLQRASDAKRVYAEIVYMKSKYFIQPDANFLPVRQPDDIEELLRQFYSEANVSTNDVEYVEASGAGIANADAYELEAITNIFTNGKSIKVGCVKSNMGHSEGASGVCAITKLCLAYHKGELSGNLHYHAPHDNVAGVCDGRIQVVTDNTPFKRGYTALNSFSFSGLNCHALLRGHYTRKDIGRYYSAIPRLVLVSGRIDNNVTKIFDALKSQTVDPELIALLHDFYDKDVSGHTARGYIVLDTDENNKTVSLAESIDHNPGINRPIWFLYSGMGSQWTTMGAELMKIPTFASAIERCHNILKPKGIDIVRILTDKDETMFDNILHSFVGIAAIQIGLTDLLKEMGIVPDNIIGHSTGEMGCAYADGCLTTEETILASYYRGLVSIETKFISGLMAAVGLGYEQVSLLCPPEIEVACHNSLQSSTISGPAEIVKKFVEDLKNKSIFAQAVQTSNIAYHSKYIAEAGPRLKSILKTLITNPKQRSNKWVCSSALQENWDDEDVKYASAEYFTNNLLSSVYFEEAARTIPANAIIIEVAPHGIMQAILKRSHQTCTNIPLTHRASPSAVNFLLKAVGKLYQTGLNPKIDILYPKVQYPVSTETPMLSSLVGWAHDEDWPHMEFNKGEVKRMSIRNFAICLDDNDWKYIIGHERNGAIIFPEAAFLVLVWETLAMHSDLDYTNMSVKFEAIRFEKELYIKKDDLIRFTIGFQMGINRFEISQEDVQIASGFIHQINKTNLKYISDENVKFNKDVILTANDIYTLLANKGYGYKEEFQSIVFLNNKYNKASIRWTSKWVTLIDSLIQLNILSKNHDGLAVPKFIRELTIDTKLHKNYNTKKENIDDVSLNAVYNDIHDTTRCGGIRITGIVFQEKQILENIPNIESLLSRSYILPNIIHMHNKSSSATPSVNNSIQVSYAGLPLYDYQNVICKGSINNIFSMDYSGHNHRGEKVMGLVSGGALSSMVEADLSLLWPVPDHWSLEDAATVPLHYAMAFYCLSIRGHLRSNQTVLVVGGAGALGQAVISLCLASNCTVFATVRNNEKKQFLLRMFPQLKEQHILSCSTSDTLGFHVMIAHHTKQALCDYVISCATGEIREQAMKCVGKYGHFLDVNMHDAVENMDFKMAYCWGARSYSAIRFSSIFLPEYSNQKELIRQLISEGIAQGIVKPLSRVVYSSTELTNGFRALASNIRRGKVLITMEDNLVHKGNLEVPAQLSLLPEASYLVIGCDSFVKIELADWLIKHGAKNIVLHQEDVTLNSYLQTKRKTWSKYGVFLTLSTINLNVYEECDNMLTECESLGPVHSIFIVENSPANFRGETLSNKNDLTPKAAVISHLDKLSRKKCNQLSNFVIVTKSNHNGNENTAIENICKIRNYNLLPALVIYTNGINEKKTCSIGSIPESLLDLFNILEKKLNCTYKNIVTCGSKKYTGADLKKYICKIIGFNNNAVSKENKTLQSLNISEINLEEIRQLINKSLQIDYSQEELQQFTFARLEHLLCGSMKGNINKSKTQGVRNFCNSIQRDEIQSSEPIVKIPNKITSSKNNIEGELDSRETHLIMIPGYEGHSRIFSYIGELLKIQAVCMQLSPDLSGNNIHEMAEVLFKCIKKTFEFRSKFYILGYSFGVNIALELAALLENEGYIGVVYCLDSSPNSVRVHLDAYLGKLTGNELQNHILSEIFYLMSGSDNEILKEELIKENDWSEKVELTLKKLRSLVTYSHDYQRAFIESFYKRIKLSIEYDPKLRLESELVLIKGILNPTTDLLDDDYDLSKYTNKPVTVFKIESDHISAPYNCQVPNIVNKFLEPKLLEAYKKINQFEFYTKIGTKVQYAARNKN